ncbi:Phage integrase family protein [Halovenus aranensis]|uniref:Phage integrase family protein n=1 Tax=Halovenus aranensis TaxID=890420 RepID=A0A1G8SSA9_9EURY|nr:tyrosine-type recombinase/integrase [Halovenus aranensis]SDJ32136.1 Phage integrase family protein [Halovenus aranensis]
MTNAPTRRLQSNRETIATHDDLDETDRDLLQEFDKQLGLRQYSTERHLKLLRHCKTLAGVVETVKGPNTTPDVSLADALNNRDAAETLVAWINRQYDNEETNRDMRVALRVFGKHVTDGDDVPEPLDWIPSTTSRSYNPTPDAADMLDWDEDIVPMTKAVHNARDKSLIAVAWDSGARAGELLDLRVGDVSDGKHGMKLSLDGKQGQRSVTLFVSSGHLAQWLDSHPAGDSSTAPLWCQLNDGTSQLSYQRCNDIIKRAGEKAEVSKPITFTNFRKSSASFLASQGVSQAVLEEHHGWSRGSDVAGRYIAIFDDASDRELARAHGLDVSEEEHDPIATIDCPRCGEPTPQDRPFCMHCHASVDVEASQLVDELTDRLDEALIERTDPDDRKDLIDVRRTIESKAGHLSVDDLHHLVSSLASND